MRFEVISEIAEVQSIGAIMAKGTQRYAICVNNTDYPAVLELRKVYRVVPDADAAQDGDLRVIDESGEDYLYPADYFVIVDFPASAIRALRKSFAREATEARYQAMNATGLSGANRYGAFCAGALSPGR